MYSGQRGPVCRLCTVVHCLSLFTLIDHDALSRLLDSLILDFRLSALDSRWSRLSTVDALSVFFHTNLRALHFQPEPYIYFFPKFFCVFCVFLFCLEFWMFALYERLPTSECWLDIEFARCTGRYSITPSFGIRTARSPNWYDTTHLNTRPSRAGILRFYAPAPR